MKTNPSRRRFAVPVAITLSAHAFLFFGFTSHPVQPPNPNPKTDCRGEFFAPVEIVYDETPPITGEKSTAKSRNLGDVAPSDFDRPAVAHVEDITVPIIADVAKTMVAAVVTTIPTGPIGEGKLGIPGDLISSRELDAVPRARSQVAPLYPSNLRAAGIAGEVTVTFVVDENGEVGTIQVLAASHPEFIEPTLRAVSRWRFEPGKREGRPVRFRMSVPLNFILNT